MLIFTINVALPDLFRICLGFREENFKAPSVWLHFKDAGQRG
jgi:hypothetical protein